MPTLSITVVGTLLAIFVADLVSHLAVHARTPTRSELAPMARVSLGAFGAAVLPLLLLAVAALPVWNLDPALRAGTAAYVLSLVLIGWLAVRRGPMSCGRRLVALGAEFVLGLAVVGLEVLARG